MTKYERYRPKVRVKKRLNPVWRGIGCLLMVIVPVISYMIGYALLQAAKSRNLIPLDLLGHPRLPTWAYETPFLSTIAQWISSLNDPLAIMIFFIAVLILLSGLISLVYTAFYQVMGPPRYTELDAQPSRHKTKEYKR